MTYEVETGQAVATVAQTAVSPQPRRLIAGPRRPLEATDKPGERVYRADPTVAAARAPHPLQLAAHAALRRAPDDPDTVMLHGLLAALRPDCPNPLLPPVAEAPSTAPFVARIRNPMDDWGGIPAGLGRRTEEADGQVTPWEVLARIATLPADAAAVLRWLRLHGTLEHSARGLFVDVGMVFASAEQLELWARDLGARRVGAEAHGRRLVFEAERAWRGVDRERGAGGD